jgi:hypothetical protein
LAYEVGSSFDRGQQADQRLSMLDVPRHADCSLTSGYHATEKGDLRGTSSF